MHLCQMSRTSRTRSHLFVLLGCLLVVCVAASGASATSSKSPNPLPAPGGGKSPNPKPAPHKHKTSKPPSTDTQTTTDKAPPSDTVQQHTVATGKTTPATKTTPSTPKTPTTSPGIGPHGAPGAGTEASEVSPPPHAPEPGTPVRGVLLSRSNTVSAALLAQLASQNALPTIGFARASAQSGSSGGSSGSWAGWLVGCLLVAALLGWGIGIELGPRRSAHERALA